MQVTTSYKATDLIQAELLRDLRPWLPGQNVLQLHIQLLFLLDEQVLQWRQLSIEQWLNAQQPNYAAH